MEVVLPPRDCDGNCTSCWAQRPYPSSVCSIGYSIGVLVRFVGFFFSSLFPVTRWVARKPARGPFLGFYFLNAALQVYQRLRAQHHFTTTKLHLRHKLKPGGTKIEKKRKRTGRTQTWLSGFFFLLLPPLNETRREAYKCLTSTFFFFFCRCETSTTLDPKTLVPSLSTFFFFVLRPATDRTASNTPVIVFFGPNNFYSFSILIQPSPRRHHFSMSPTTLFLFSYERQNAKL